MGLASAVLLYRALEQPVVFITLVTVFFTLFFLDVLLRTRQQVMHGFTSLVNAFSVAAVAARSTGPPRATPDGRGSWSSRSPQDLSPSPSVCASGCCGCRRPLGASPSQATGPPRSERQSDDFLPRPKKRPKPFIGLPPPAIPPTPAASICSWTTSAVMRFVAVLLGEVLDVAHGELAHELGCLRDHGDRVVVPVHAHLVTGLGSQHPAWPLTRPRAPSPSLRAASCAPSTSTPRCAWHRRAPSRRAQHPGSTPGCCPAVRHDDEHLGGTQLVVHAAAEIARGDDHVLFEERRHECVRAERRTCRCSGLHRPLRRGAAPICDAHTGSQTTTIHSTVGAIGYRVERGGAQPLDGTQRQLERSAVDGQARFVGVGRDEHWQQPSLAMSSLPSSKPGQERAVRAVVVCRGSCARRDPSSRAMRRMAHASTRSLAAYDGVDLVAERA